MLTPSSFPEALAPGFDPWIHWLDLLPCSPATWVVVTSSIIVGIGSVKQDTVALLNAADPPHVLTTMSKDTSHFNI